MLLLLAHLHARRRTLWQSVAVLEVPDSIVLDKVEVLDSVEELPDSVDLVAVEIVADSIQHESLCPRCATIHAGSVFGKECYQARREVRRCACCGLLHEDYDVRLGNSNPTRLPWTTQDKPIKLRKFLVYGVPAGLFNKGKIGRLLSN